MMTPLPSYTRPLAQDRLAYALARGWIGAAMILALCAGGLIVARATLATLAALPNLTAPALPGCC